MRINRDCKVSGYHPFNNCVPYRDSEPDQGKVGSDLHSNDAADAADVLSLLVSLNGMHLPRGTRYGLFLLLSIEVGFNFV